MSRPQQDNVAPASKTTRERLTSIVKSARDIMRKDAGLSGDIDRIPQLAWLLFLKAFDGVEQNRELIEVDYRPAILSPFRWRDWAAEVTGPTGDALLSFVNNELLPHLRELSGKGAFDSRDVVSSVFRETSNRMVSGYLLRDVVNLVDQIDFASSDDIHTMAQLYESLLQEMRDAAGDSGEFYTPRPVIRFMVERTGLRLGQTILDPAAGTGGFLVEAYEHLREEVRTVGQQRALEQNIQGVEKKPLPYLLCMMNLMLHGVVNPRISRGNSLARPISQIGKAERVDVVLTNPPFGGEEEKSVQSNFPLDRQTSETALLFMQLVMRQLAEGGRCAIVVPNGVLFSDGVGAKVKAELLTKFDVHTIVRLPAGVFAPYTPIPSNLLFFDRTGPTKETWYYEVSPPEGRKAFSKTLPITTKSFSTCTEWWDDRHESSTAWRVPAADIIESGYNLDIRNPNQVDLADQDPKDLVDILVRQERELLSLLDSLAEGLGVSDA